MSDNQSTVTCTLVCWLVALLGGLLAIVLLMMMGGWGFMGAFFIGFLLFVLGGILLSWMICSPLPAAGQAPAPTAGTTGMNTSSAAPSSATESTAATSAVSSPAADTESASAVEETVSEPVGDASSAAVAGTSSSSAASSGQALVKPSTPLAGQEELAGRKGEWRYEADGGSNVAASSGASASAASSADAAQSETAAPEPSATAAAATDAQGIPDYDGDGTLEGTNEGEKPTVLSGPRDGKADNLKEIKGIGPKLEKAVNGIGVYHFDQIAAWTSDEVAWVNANLIGFKGRVTRDNWVEQAKILAEGGETEFSKRVGKGGVYD